MALVWLSVTWTLPSTTRRSQAVISPERLMPWPTVRRFSGAAAAADIVGSMGDAAGVQAGEGLGSANAGFRSGCGCGRVNVGSGSFSGAPPGRGGSLSFLRNIRYPPSLRAINRQGALIGTQPAVDDSRITVIRVGWQSVKPLSVILGRCEPPGDRPSEATRSGSDGSGRRCRPPGRTSSP